MIDVNFKDYLYYPALRTRESEVTGYQQLSEEYKNRIIPLFTLYPWPRGTCSDSIEKINEATSDLPYFLDLPIEDEIRAKLNKDSTGTLTKFYQDLENPSNNFENWIKFIQEQNNVIPIVQIRKANIQQSIKQSMILESICGKVGFRIRDEKESLRAIAGLGALENTDNAIVFLDCQYISSSTIEQRKSFCLDMIKLIRDEYPNILICVLSTSFPQSPSSREDIEELNLFSAVNYPYDKNIVYGDYGSIYSKVYDEDIRYSGAPPARIDYPLDDFWDIRRYSGQLTKDNSIKYQAIAESLINDYPIIEQSQCWGEKKIHETANGHIYSTARNKWIGVRVNIHLRNQIFYNDFLINDEFYSFDDSDE